MDLSVILPTHNPNPERLRRALLGLRAQTLQTGRWETILVNNASTEFPGSAYLANYAPESLSLVEEPSLGLSEARRRGFSAARGEVAVLVDDDNVLEPDYLEMVLDIFARQPRVGVAGGRSLPEFERAPVAWEMEFLPLLALRDLGPNELISSGFPTGTSTFNIYPTFAPIGAGMALRRGAWSSWIASLPAHSNTLPDRRGGELTSGGDNDIVFAALGAGWEVGYFPCLSLLHLIPASRLEAGYLARLNRGIQKSWMQVLARHDASPWPPLSSTGAQLRKIKAWFAYAAWSSTPAQVRWQGVCGHFDGRVIS